MRKILTLNFLPAGRQGLISNILISCQNKIIVLATGCFDLLHPGHFAFLKAAKKQGDILIVGLESDARIRFLKGAGRPINSFKIRAENLAKLKAVDYIFPLPESFGKASDHLKLLQLIKPKVLAVSENTPYLKRKKKLIEKIGGKIFVFPFDPKFSTTSLLTLKHSCR